VFAPEVADDRDDIQPGDRVLLLIEDDVAFAEVLLQMAREKGFKGLVALRGDIGLSLAREYKPDAITLDLRLPVLDGWTVLDRLKHDARTRHIPVHLISGSDIDARPRALKQGALAFLQKPVSPEALAEALGAVKGFVERRVRNLLIVEDDDNQRKALVELIGNGDVVTTAVGSAEESLNLLRTQHFDCMVLDLGLPDMTGFDLINMIKSRREAARAADHRLHRQGAVAGGGDPAQAGDRRDHRQERALDGAPARRDGAVPPPRRGQPAAEQAADAQAGPPRRPGVQRQEGADHRRRRSQHLRHHQRARALQDGRHLRRERRRGIEVLHANPDVNVVLMDVMMPEMDGYETTREIRKEQRFANLPIIALTAKAMKGDREKCLEAGASDYITKPVEPEQLVSLLRVWLYG
jgi:CheY-like chemotaxis protein